MPFDCYTLGQGLGWSYGKIRPCKHMKNYYFKIQYLKNKLALESEKKIVLLNIGKKYVM